MIASGVPGVSVVIQVEPILLIFVGLYTAAAAVTDLRTQKIPNWLTVTGAVLGLLYHTLAGTQLGFVGSLLGLLVGFSLLLLPFVLGGGGGGDVKLLAGLGAWVGWKLVLVIFAFSACIGLVIAMCVMVATACNIGGYATKRRFNIAGAGKADGKPRKLKQPVRFALPIAIGSWLVLAALCLKHLGGS